MASSIGSIAIVAGLGAALVVALVFSEKLRAKLYPPEKFWPYFARRVLSPAEQLLYGILVEALPEHMVLAQLPLAKVIAVKRQPYAETWANRIAHRTLDFVVCRPDSTVVAAIQLEDPGRRDPLPRQADRFIDNALAAAGIALLRWNAAALPSEAEIRRLVAQEPSAAATRRAAP